MDWFPGWVAMHCEATGAVPQTSATLIANRQSFVTDWSATAGELGECTHRLVSFLRVPKFPNEHAESIARELMLLRRERAEARDRAAAATLAAPGRVPSVLCRQCGDTGFVTVPLYLCVECPRDDPPRLVPHPGYAGVLTGSVLCDRPDCAPGRRVRDAEAKVTRPRPTLTAYTRRFGCVDVVAMLREHERAVTEYARMTAPKDEGGFAESIAQLRARATGTHTEAA